MLVHRTIIARPWKFYWECNKLHGPIPRQKISWNNEKNQLRN